MNTILITAPGTSISQPTASAPQRPGSGTRLTVNSIGVALSRTRRGSRFNHPFRPSLGGFRVRFTRGLVEFIEPKIGKLPMSKTLLSLQGKKPNENGESWVVIEVEPNEEGVVTGDSRVEIVHSTEPLSLDPALGRMPIAMILWRGARQPRPAKALPIVHFNLRYVRFQPPAGGGPVRHLFT